MVQVDEDVGERERKQIDAQEAAGVDGVVSVPKDAAGRGRRRRRARRRAPALQHGNGAPKPENPRVFTLLGDGFGSNAIPAGLLMG